MSLLNGMLAYSCALHALSAHEVSIFIWDAYFVCFACFVKWRAYIC